MKQEQLPLPREMQVVDLSTVRRMPSMTRAISLCAELGGFENDKDFCREVEIDPAVWSQIQTGARYFPQDKYERLFEVCGNEAPLLWLADRRGYVLTPKETEMERRLRAEREKNERLASENKLLRDLVQGKAT